MSEVAQDDGDELAKLRAEIVKLRQAIEAQPRPYAPAPYWYQPVPVPWPWWQPYGGITYTTGTSGNDFAITWGNAG